MPEISVVSVCMEPERRSLCRSLFAEFEPAVMMARVPVQCLIVPEQRSPCRSLIASARASARCQCKEFVVKCPCLLCQSQCQSFVSARAKSRFSARASACLKSPSSQWFIYSQHPYNGLNQVFKIPLSTMVHVLDGWLATNFGLGSVANSTRRIV